MIIYENCIQHIEFRMTGKIANKNKILKKGDLLKKKTKQIPELINIICDGGSGNLISPTAIKFGCDAGLLNPQFYGCPFFVPSYHRITEQIIEGKSPDRQKQILKLDFNSTKRDLGLRILHATSLLTKKIKYMEPDFEDKSVCCPIVISIGRGKETSIVYHYKHDWWLISYGSKYDEPYMTKLADCKFQSPLTPITSNETPQHVSVMVLYNDRHTKASADYFLKCVKQANRGGILCYKTEPCDVLEPCGKIAVISDIHSNIQALTAVVEECKKLGIQEYVCLGDIIGYGNNPLECIALIASLNCMAVVRGNHEDFLVNDKWMNGIVGQSASAKASMDFDRTKLPKTTREYKAIDQLDYSFTDAHHVVYGHSANIFFEPGDITCDTRGNPLYLENWSNASKTAGSPMYNWGYCRSETDALGFLRKRIAQLIEIQSLLFIGHSHVSKMFATSCSNPQTTDEIDLIWKPNQGYNTLKSKISFMTGGPGSDSEVVKIGLKKSCRYVVDVGSVGQPRDDDPRASFVIYNQADNTVSFRRVVYDYKAAMDTFAEVGKKADYDLEKGNSFPRPKW